MKVKIVIEIAHGMNYLHKKGMIHRDLKIENIDFFNDYENKYLIKSSNLIKTKATFYNFDDAPIEVYFILHLHDFVINIIDIKSKIKLFTIPGSTILFIQSNLNAINHRFLWLVE